jgi:PAS domain-containing protein
MARAPREEVSPQNDFGTTLRSLMQRPTHVVTPGWLSKMSGIPKATIVNWLEGRVARPRTGDVLHEVCDALRLRPEEIRALYAAAGIVWPGAVDAHVAYDHVPVGLYATTLDGAILHANLTLVNMLGYANYAEYRQLDVARDLYASAEQRRTWIRDILRSGTLIRQPVWAKRADGSRVFLLDSATVVRDPHGNVVRFEGVWESADF